jgi:hypothetical protein
LVGKLKGKLPTGIPKHKWDYTFETGLNYDEKFGLEPSD